MTILSLDQLRGYWKFNNDLLDYSTRGNHATLFSGTATYVAGLFGNAIRLSGVGVNPAVLLRVPNSPSLNLKQDMTIAFIARSNQTHPGATLQNMIGLQGTIRQFTVYRLTENNISKNQIEGIGRQPAGSATSFGGSTAGTDTFQADGLLHRWIVISKWTTPTNLQAVFWKDGVKIFTGNLTTIASGIGSGDVSNLQIPITQSTNLLHGWLFNNNLNDDFAKFSGQTADAGTMTGTTTYISGPFGTDSALSFDEASYCTMANESHYDTSKNQAFSVSFWIYPDSSAVGNFPCAVSKLTADGAANQGWFIYWTKAGSAIGFKFDDGTSAFDLNSGNNSVPAGQWSHVVCIFSGNGNGNGKTIYINKVLKATGATATITGDLLNNIPFTVGAVGAGNQKMKGGVANVLFFNNAISTNMINNLFAASPPTSPGNFDLQQLSIWGRAFSDAEAQLLDSMWLSGIELDKQAWQGKFDVALNDTMLYDTRESFETKYGKLFVGPRSGNMVVAARTGYRFRVGRRSDEMRTS